MKILTEPKVFCIMQPQVDMWEIEDFMQEAYGLPATSWEHTAEQYGEMGCEFAGRVCYGSFGPKQGRRTSEEYFDNIFTSKHGSVLEHANYTFAVTGISRCCTHELVRHRAGFSYSQESTRYVSYDPESVRYVIPEYEEYTLDMQKQIAATLATTLFTYEDMKNERAQKGEKKKDRTTAARRIINQCLEAKIIFTANIRALRHFCALRGAMGTDTEIRSVAILVAKKMKELAPILFADFNHIPADDPSETGYLTTVHGGKI